MCVEGGHPVNDLAIAPLSSPHRQVAAREALLGGAQPPRLVCDSPIARRPSVCSAVSRHAAAVETSANRTTAEHDFEIVRIPCFCPRWDLDSTDQVAPLRARCLSPACHRVIDGNSEKVFLDHPVADARGRLRPRRERDCQVRRMCGDAGSDQPKREGVRWMPRNAENPPGFALYTGSPSPSQSRDIADVACLYRRWKPIRSWTDLRTAGSR